MQDIPYNLKIYENLVRQLDADGYRITRIRHRMLKIFSSNPCLLSLTEITKQATSMLKPPERTTIYRELCFLQERQLIRKVQISDKVYYEINLDHHHHLICTACQKVQEIELGEHLQNQEKSIWQEKKFKVTDHQLEFYGLCQKCY